MLCEPDDVSALWAWKELQARGLQPFELVTSDELGPGRRWAHRVSSHLLDVEISMSPGRVIRSEQVTGVLNRMRYVPAWRPAERAETADRDYALQEVAAFSLSWVSALPGPVLNRPTPQGLSGRQRDIVEWTWLAAKAGLETTCLRMSAPDGCGPEQGLSVSPRTEPDADCTVMVVGPHVVGTDVPPVVRDGCRRLAVLSGTALLGVSFGSCNQRSWVFAQADVLPDLRVGGSQLIDAVARVFQQDGAS
jgi:hypothetical protein